MWFILRLVQTRLVRAGILVWSTDGRLSIDVRLIEITSIDCARLLKTYFKEIERSFVELRLSEKQSASIR